MAASPLRLLVAACTIGLGLSHLALPDETQALLQSSIDTKQLATPTFEGDKPHSGSMVMPNKTFNCMDFPSFCAPPFNCGGGHIKRGKRGTAVATFEGHANYQEWCDLYPTYAKPMVACASGDLKQYANMMYAEQLEMSTGFAKFNISHLQAQYCFHAGHCNDTEVTETTTLAEMEQICDKRWTHKAWTEFRMKPDLYIGMLSGINTGHFHTNLRDLRKLTIDDGISRGFAQTACGMGNFHCDVVYCKEKYCNTPAWVAEFGQLAWKDKPLVRKDKKGGRVPKPRQYWSDGPGGLDA